jgi:hypothetical protein
MHYKPLPGCLDYRFLKECGDNCVECSRYYDKWELCCIDGYEIEIINMHKDF